MKRFVLPVALASLSLGLAGCVVLSFGGKGSRHDREVVREIVVNPANSEESATFAEIEAAAKLSFDASRVKSLKAIAERPNLSQNAQVHLVNCSLKRLDFDASRQQVILALIQNPAFCAPAKEAIMTQLNAFDFDPSRTRILDEIQKRSVTAAAK